MGGDRRLAVPAGEHSGRWWATCPRDCQPTKLRALRDQIAEYCDPHIGPTPPQVAIELADDGEPYPWGDAGHPPEWRVEPWAAVVCIGRPGDAAAAVDRILADDVVGEALCRGADVRLGRRGDAGHAAHRAEAAAIRDRLAGPPPGDGAPIPDQVAYRATRLAAGVPDAGGGPAGAAEVVGPTAGPSREASGLDCRHTPDFTSVVWFGTPCTFGKGQQARSVEVLWEQWEKGLTSMSQEQIAERIGAVADNFELAKVFRRKGERHDAWGTMIRRTTKGCYGLVPPEPA